MNNACIGVEGIQKLLMVYNLHETTCTVLYFQNSKEVLDALVTVAKSHVDPA